MTLDLRDYALMRQGELSRTLAGLATVDPALVLDLAHKLRPDDLTDAHARQFLTALTPDADPLTVARKLGLTVDYVRWLGLACDELPTLKQSAIAAADEIKRLTITRATLAGLSDWLKEAGKIGGYHV